MAELIVPLDLPQWRQAKQMVEAIGPEAGFYKVGLELFTAEGPAPVHALRDLGKQVFLDLKLHDIPQTVARAVRAAGNMGASLLTIHAGGGRRMIEAAREAAGHFGENRPRLLAVTVLTSLDAGDLTATGVRRGPASQVASLARLAMDAGADGIVCSPLECAAQRRHLGPRALIVTPGIRPAGYGADDQKRTADPASAVRAGATHLVVGRPITAADDPAAAARAINTAMARA